MSSWLGEDFVRSRIIGDGKGARRLNKAIGLLGRNGLLVVFICRLSYPIPYGVSNYLFGLTGIKRRDIAIGTALGGVPVYAGWVAAGEAGLGLTMAVLGDRGRYQSASSDAVGAEILSAI